MTQLRHGLRVLLIAHCDSEPTSESHARWSSKAAAQRPDEAAVRMASPCQNPSKRSREGGQAMAVRQIREFIAQLRPKHVRRERAAEVQGPRRSRREKPSDELGLLDAHGREITKRAEHEPRLLDPSGQPIPKSQPLQRDDQSR
jgi:hypothetical protein